MVSSSPTTPQPNHATSSFLNRTTHEMRALTYFIKIEEARRADGTRPNYKTGLCRVNVIHSRTLVAEANRQAETPLTKRQAQSIGTKSPKKLVEKGVLEPVSNKGHYKMAPKFNQRYRRAKRKLNPIGSRDLKVIAKIVGTVLGKHLRDRNEIGGGGDEDDEDDNDDNDEEEEDEDEDEDEEDGPPPQKKLRMTAEVVQYVEAGVQTVNEETESNVPTPRGSAHPMLAPSASHDSPLTDQDEDMEDGDHNPTEEPPFAALALQPNQVDEGAPHAATHSHSETLHEGPAAELNQDDEMEDTDMGIAAEPGTPTRRHFWPLVGLPYGEDEDWEQDATPRSLQSSPVGPARTASRQTLPGSTLGPSGHQSNGPFVGSSRSLGACSGEPTASKGGQDQSMFGADAAGDGTLETKGEIQVLEDKLKLANDKVADHQRTIETLRAGSDGKQAQIKSLDTTLASLRLQLQTAQIELHQSGDKYTHLSITKHKLRNRALLLEQEKVVLVREATQLRKRLDYALDHGATLTEKSLGLEGDINRLQQEVTLGREKLEAAQQQTRDAEMLAATWQKAAEESANARAQLEARHQIDLQAKDGAMEQLRNTMATVQSQLETVVERFRHYIQGHQQMGQQALADLEGTL